MNFDVSRLSLSEHFLEKRKLTVLCYSCSARRQKTKRQTDVLSALNRFLLFCSAPIDKNKRKFLISIAGTASAVGSSSPRTLPARSNSEHKKSVTFDDGVKPGAESPPTNVVSTTKNRSASADFDKKFCFDAGFCFSLDRFDEPNDFLLLSKNEEIWTDEKLDEKQKLLETSSDEPVEFRIHNNLLLLGQIFENGK